MTNTTPLSQPESVDMVEADGSTPPTRPSSLWRDDEPVPLTSLSSDRQDEVPAPSTSTSLQQEDMGLSSRFSTEPQLTETPLSAPSLSATDSSTEYQSVYASLYNASSFKSAEPVSLESPTLAPAVEPESETVQPADVPVAVEVTESAPLSQAETDSLTTGQRLRQLREQKHLTIQNVADKLYLDIGVIQALESDHYESLPPEIFVRGYLRGYAKILEVPANGLLEKYDAHVGRKPPPPITPQAKPKKQATTNDLWVKVLTYTIFLTLMILMVLWGVNHYALSPPADINNTLVSGENELRANGTEGEYVPPSEGDDDPKNPGQPVVATQPVVTPPTPPAPPPPPVDLRSVKIHYAKTGVWTQVRDSKAAKPVYEGTPKAGEVVEVKGEPPFKVKFGPNSAGIEIEYKGQKAAADTYPKEPKGKKLITVGEAIPATPPAAPVPPAPPVAPTPPTPPTPPTR